MAVEGGAVQTEQIAEYTPGTDWDSLGEWLNKMKAKAGELADSLKKKLDQAKGKMNAKAEAASAKANKVKSRQGTGDSSSGVFSDIICCKMPNFLARLKTAQFDLGLGKSLNWNPSAYFSVCGKQMSLNLMDSIGAVAKFIQKNPGILSFDKDAMLAALMKSDLLNKSDAFGLKRLLRDCLLRRFTNAQAGLYGSDGSFGPSLASRNYLRTKMAQDPCLSAIGQLPIVSNFLANNNIGLLLSTVMYMHDNGWNAEGWYSLTDSVFNALGLRNNAIAGLAKSIAYSIDYNTYKIKHKLALGRYYKSKNIITKQHDAIIYTPPKVIIEKLDIDTKYEEEVEKKVLTPELAEQEYQVVVDGLDVFSPGWEEYEAACSTTLQKAIDKTLKNKKQTYELTLDYSNNKLEKIHKIALINKFNCCSGCKPTAGKSITRVSCNCA